MTFFKKLGILSAMSVACLSVASAQNAPAPTYFKKHGDWGIECYSTGNGQDCQTFFQAEIDNPQKKTDKNAPAKLPVLRVSMAMFDKEPVMIFTAPLAVQLSEGLKLRLNENTDKGKIFIKVKDIDPADKKEKEIETDITQINFERCLQSGCMAALPFNIDVSNQLMSKIQKGNKLIVSFTFDSAQKDKAINADVSLKGFTDAYNDLVEQSKKK